MEKGIIDVGKCERNLGSTFVQFSRFKKLNNFLVNPFSFDRLTKIGLSKSLAPRLEEENRLEIINKSTKIKYQHLLN